MSVNAWLSTTTLVESASATSPAAVCTCFAPHAAAAADTMASAAMMSTLFCRMSSLLLHVRNCRRRTVSAVSGRVSGLPLVSFTYESTPRHDEGTSPRTNAGIAAVRRPCVSEHVPRLDRAQAGSRAPDDARFHLS